MIRSKSVFAKAVRRLFQRLKKQPRDFLNFSENFICKFDGTVYEKPEPQLFSFNSPFGACPTCQGFGNTTGVDYDLVVPNPLLLSIKEGAIDRVFATCVQMNAQRDLIKFAKAKEFRQMFRLPILKTGSRKIFWKATDNGAA